VRIVVLTPQEAEDAWKVKAGGAEHLLITAQDFFADADEAPGRIWLHSRDIPQFAFSFTPPIAATVKASLPLTESAGNAMVMSFTAEAKPANLDLKYIQVQDAGDAPPVKAGPAQPWRVRGVPQAPAEAAFSQAARWSFTLPPGVMDDLSELFLEVDYQGDVARLSAAHHLLDDDFYKGHPWFVGLGRFLEPGSAGKFELSILPLRKDAGLYFELSKPINFPSNGQIDELDGLRLVPEYQLMLTTAGAK
jgi:hypothetical protein